MYKYLHEAFARAVGGRVETAHKTTKTSMGMPGETGNQNERYEREEESSEEFSA